jgi:hypothetical protein
MDVAERHALLEQLIDVVFVKRGRRHYEDRVMICPKGTAPAKLPHPGKPRSKLRSYEIRRGWIRPGYRASRETRARSLGFSSLNAYYRQRYLKDLVRLEQLGAELQAPRSAVRTDLRAAGIRTARHPSQRRGP